MTKKSTSEASRKRWADPKQRAKMIASNKKTTDKIMKARLAEFEKNLEEFNKRNGTTNERKKTKEKTKTNQKKNS
jgi:hypothetical protein